VARQFVRVVVDCDACQMEQCISLVTLGVTDLARARSFYEAMGWAGAQQPDEEVCFFQAGGMVLGLWTALGGTAHPVSNSRRMFEPPKRLR
jgi:catechol 2,3-dioxygenase-like lactoylglutathione lyase family enzyme